MKCPAFLAVKGCFFSQFLGKRVLQAAVFLGLGLGVARADLMDDAFALQNAQDDAMLNVLSARPVDTTELAAQIAQFSTHIDPATVFLLNENPVASQPADLGAQQGNFQHILALEMLQAQRSGQIEDAKAWRALIQLPKHANAIEGALALQRLGSQPEVTTMLAREYLSWQTSRIREKLDLLKRSQASGHVTEALVAARIAEMDRLANFPAALYSAAGLPAHEAKFGAFSSELTPDFAARFAAWRDRVEATLPNLLSPEDVARRERLVLKLLQLVPKEYRAGVRDGQIVVPLEYREAQTFLVQAQQLINELTSVWQKTRTQALAENLNPLREQLDLAEAAVARKAPLAEVEKPVTAARDIATGKLGLSLTRVGANAVEETALDVRTALSASLAAARAGRWSEAESQRLDAYATFDTAIEIRVLPRAPELAIKAERSFLDGTGKSPGIKAVLDRRERGPLLDQTYQQTLAHLDECVALLKVSVSPTNISLTTATIVMREGLEAIVILAALLAGMRGVESGAQRKQVGAGVILALLFTGLTFWLSRTLIQSLSHYGEKLEAVISVLAVLILLMVTNWVFHKVYWVQWNAKLRQLRNQVTGENGRPRWEWLGLVGVGFLTIYREGFETSLFLQSLLLEGGLQPVLIGVAGGFLFVVVVGLGIFGIGKKLPYRKLLIVTGVLIVTVLVTFLGSTVRLFQTVGWMPINPITWLDLPAWMGTWLGLYPSWEGLLIPPLGLAYVGSAWLWTKWQAARKQIEHPAARLVSVVPTKKQPAFADV